MMFLLCSFHLYVLLLSSRGRMDAVGVAIVPDVFVIIRTTAVVVPVCAIVDNCICSAYGAHFPHQYGI